MLVNTPNNLATIIGIDPGTSFLGLAIFMFDVKTLDLVYTSSELVRGVSVLDSNLVDYHGERFARLRYMENHLLNRFNQFNPIAVVAENNFMDTRRPNAYGALVEAVSCIRNALLNHHPHMPLELIVPSMAKKAVLQGNAKKEAVSKALLNTPIKNTYQGITALENITDHESDALAIAYWRYLQLLEDANSFKGV